MAAKATNRNNSRTQKKTLLQKFSGFFFEKSLFTLFVVIALLAGGGYVYNSVIQKEGFPPVQFPVAVVTGQYFVDDAATVDSQAVQPLTEVIEKVDGVREVQSVANDNFYQVIIFFEEGVLAANGTGNVKNAIEKERPLPERATVQYQQIEPAKFLNEYDLLLSVYSQGDASADDLQEVAEFVSGQMQEREEIEEAKVQPLLSTDVNPVTGASIERQTAFSRIGLRENDDLKFYPAITIGIKKTDAVDVLQLSDAADEAIDNLNLSQFDGTFRVVRSADFADVVSSQIDSLQSNLFGGLIAVAVVSFILISWRASIITAAFMIVVMATVVLVLWAVGFTLNSITLFGLVLSLGLFVDDATIVVEAIDAARTKKRSKREVAQYAIKRVAGASLAGTLTTVFVFLPLVFVSGILGEFIRLLPITVIVALLTSLILSLTVIPVLSKYLLLTRQRMPGLHKYNPVSRLEIFLSERLSRLPLLLKSSPKKGLFFGALSLLISFGFIAGAGYFASRMSFNIFPATKDSEQVAYTINFAPGTTIEVAQDITDEVNRSVSEAGGADIERIAFGRTGQANERSADALVELTPINSRDITSQQLIQRLSLAANRVVDDNQATVRFVQIDAGPPAEQFPFKMQVYGEDDTRTLTFLQQVQSELEGSVVELANGETARVTATQIANPTAITRDNNRRFIELQAAFDSQDTSAVVQAVQASLEKKFTEAYLKDSGLSQNDITFDFGQESENADSFSSLSVAFPIAIVLMYVLLALQFKSFAQPLLIFMAIPFSLFGVFAGLYLTENPFSFFVQVGLIGLIGIAVNNSILLTDYANQEKRAGKDSYRAISAATKLRFRPLLATSLTTVVALTPLALSDPFWEPLALTIIFGLLSSTFLVIIAFPYYYLLFEAVRHKPIVKQGIFWLIGLGIGLAVIGLQAAALPFVALYVALTLILKRYWSQIGK